MAQWQTAQRFSFNDLLLGLGEVLLNLTESNENILLLLMIESNFKLQIEPFDPLCIEVR